VPALRLDTAAPLRRVVETPQGGLRIEAALSRAGVLRYRDDAGQEWAELVPPETLRDDAALATLRGATVTDLHPPGLVTAETYRDVAVGHVHDDPRIEGDYLVATLTVNDAAEVARIRSGERKDTSAGYVCDLDETPGVFEGERYDRVQRNRRYNHVGLGPEGWGRAGSDVGLRLDGGAVAVRVDAPAGDPTMKKTIKLRGREVHLDMAEGEDKKLQMALDEDMGAVDEKIQKKDAEMGALGAQIDGLQTALTDALTQVATLGAAMKAMEAMKAEPAAEPSEEVLDAALAVREAVRADAAKVLGAEVSLAGKKPAEIKRLVVAKVLPTVKLDGLSADAIEGMYRGAVAAVSTVTRNDGLAAANAAANGRDPQNPAAVKTDGDDDMGAKLRARTHAASRAPLTVNGKV
jgi:hypothetical protein